MTKEEIIDELLRLNDYNGFIKVEIFTGLDITYHCRKESIILKEIVDKDEDWKNEYVIIDNKIYSLDEVKSIEMLN